MKAIALGVRIKEYLQIKGKNSNTPWRAKAITRSVQPRGLK
jgi:hypothetical protein